MDELSCLSESGSYADESLFLLNDRNQTKSKLSAEYCNEEQI